MLKGLVWMSAHDLRAPSVEFRLQSSGILVSLVCLNAIWRQVTALVSELTALMGLTDVRTCCNMGQRRKEKELEELPL